MGKLLAAIDRHPASVYSSQWEQCRRSSTQAGFAKGMEAQAACSTRSHTTATSRMQLEQLTRRPTGAPALRVNEALARRSLRTPKGTLPTQGIPQKENDSLAFLVLLEITLATLQLREDNAGVNL